MPVSYAEQLSYSTQEQQKLEENLAEINNSKVVSELVINVSENGNITILESNSYGAELSNTENNMTPDDLDNFCIFANSLSLGVQYFAFLESSGDVDWHKWNLPSSGKFTVNVDVPSNKDYDIEVWESCSLFAKRLCISDKGRGSAEQCTVNANSGNIYTKVYGYAGDYSSNDRYLIKGTFASNRYNLVPGDFTVTPTNPSNADSISIRYHTTNLGPDHITSRFYSRLYISNNLYQTCDFSSGAQAGTTYYCERSGITLPAGTHRLKNIVDADNQISETNENDNAKEQDLPVRDVTGVDLVPGDFTITPSSPTEADSIIVRYRITNLGPASISGYFNYKLYIDNTLYQTCNANNGISSGSTQYCERSDIRLSRGTHTLKNVVDADSNIAETNEGNNVKTQSLYVPRFDLTPGDFTVTPSNPSNTDSITIRYHTVNNGPDHITTRFYSRFYIDNSLYQTCDFTSGAQAGITYYCEASNIKLSVGIHKLKNFVDSDYQISEANENNNVKEQDLFVKDVGGSDLVPGDFTVTPSSPTEADSITIRYRATNLGPGDITKYFNFKLYIDGVLSQTCESSNGLSAGSTGYCERTGIKLNAGTHVLKNVVDESNNVAELNEFNNVKLQNLGISSACPANYPYYCPSNNYCFSKSEYCDGRQVYQCLDKIWVCVDRTAIGTCVGSSIYCCPSNYPYYWTSDGRCHTTPQTQVTCNIPDGTSSECDCDSNSECPSTNPYCEDNYPSPISDGYDACLSSQPQYCGNGLCLSGESYLNCPQDCTAPKGTINVNVYHSSNNAPISGAYVYYDNVLQGTTDSSGKKNLEASFGQRNVKVECPDKTYCNTKTVNVDGTEYVSFGCNCVQQLSYSNLRIKLITQPSDYPRGFPIGNVDVYLDDSYKGATNQFGTIDIENILAGSHKINIFLKILEDGQDKLYTGGTSLSLFNPYEEKNFTIVKGQSPASLNVLENRKELFVLQEYNSSNINPNIIPIIAAAFYAAITIGGIAWDTYDYYNCLNKNSQSWQPAANNWNSYNCVTSTSMTPEQYNDCVAKALSKNQNSADNNCVFEGGMLALNFVPIAGVTKTLAKVGVKIGKVIRFFPHIDNLIENAYKVGKPYIQNGQTFVEVTDNLKNGAKYVYKVVDNGFKVVDNVVGIVTKKVSQLSPKIAQATDEILLNTKPSDLTEVINPTDFGNVKGALGERAAVKTADIVKDDLAKEGASFVRHTGIKDSIFKESPNFKLYFNDKGKIEVFDKITRQELGDLDDFYKINEKMIVTEVKTMSGTNLDDQILRKRLGSKVINRLAAIKEVTGETPEFIIMVPKGEVAVSKELSNFLTKVRNAGFKAEYAEVGGTNDAFNKATERINNLARAGG